MKLRQLLGSALLVVTLVPALSAAAPFIRLPVGKATVSVRTDLPLPANTPLWLHLHGATDTVEPAFASLTRPGVLATLTLPGLSKVYADHFADPAAFDTLLRDITETVRRASGQAAWTPGELTVSSFSAGFGGVRQLLRQPAAFDRIAVLVMADSIYCGYAGAPAEHRVDSTLMEGFLRFARLATEGRKRLLVTHTQQVPEGYASTTETADYLLTHTGGERHWEEIIWTTGLTQTSRCRRGGFEVIGFQGAEAKDHLQHLRALGLFLARASELGRQPAEPTR